MFLLDTEILYDLKPQYLQTTLLCVYSFDLFVLFSAGIFIWCGPNLVHVVTGFVRLYVHKSYIEKTLFSWSHPADF